MTKVPSTAKKGNGPVGTGNDTIDQVRDLLFGDAQRSNAERFEAIETMLVQMEKRLSARLDRIEQEIEARTEAVASAHRGSILEMGKAVAAVGEQFKSLADLSDLISQDDAKKSD